MLVLGSVMQDVVLDSLRDLWIWNVLDVFSFFFGGGGWGWE